MKKKIEVLKIERWAAPLKLSVLLILIYTYAEVKLNAVSKSLRYHSGKLESSSCVFDFTKYKRSCGV